MSYLYLFNPENDLALATDSPYFTPPAQARKLADDLACMPVWLADGCDKVLASVCDQKWLECTRQEFGIECQVTQHVDSVSDSPDPRPWGWSTYARRLFIDAGVDASLLPDNNRLTVCRELSHRRSSIKISGMLSLPYPTPPVPEETSHVDDVMVRISRGEHLFVKSPWSGSGRGVLDTETAPPRQIERLVTGMIKHQGSVVVEKALDKVCDFAMLYDVKDGHTDYVGLSVFNNFNYSVYGGNILDSESRLEDRLEKFVSRESIHATRDAMAEVINDVVGGNGYRGPVGIDMMLYRHESDGEVLIAPCVELNLRMTMGRVAHEIMKRYVSPSSCGTMAIVTNPYSITVEKPIVVDKRLIEGSYRLTSAADAKFGLVMNVKGL